MREDCGKCNVFGVLLRIMQCVGMEVNCLIFSYVTLILRSPFALPSVWLRDGFEVAPSCFGLCFYCNKLIVKELCFSAKKGVGMGGF